MTEQDRIAMNEIIKAIENLSATLGALEESLTRKGLLDSQVLLGLKATHAAKSRQLMKSTRQIFQIPRS